MIPECKLNSTNSHYERLCMKKMVAMTVLYTTISFSTGIRAAQSDGQVYLS
jgi:hypothetical protein